jgi:predicted metalloprotease
MELNENAEIDTSQIEDRRGSGGGGGGLAGLPIPGGPVGIIITLVVLVLGGGGYGLSQLGGNDSGSADNGTLQQECGQQNADRLKNLDCRNNLYVNAIQDYWRDALPQNFKKVYQPAKTVFFEQQTNTGCGAADAGVGPFYCPADDKVYIDLTFYRVLADQLGAPGEFAQPYVLAHEYGHHVQDLLGTEAQMRRQQQRDPGNANELSVRLELQADCYAGSWAKHATETDTSSGKKIFKSLTQADIQQGLDTARQIGDDTLQQRGGGRINPKEFTHGTSEQRVNWFKKGFGTGDPKQCDTFNANTL